MSEKIYLSPPHMGGKEIEYIKDAIDSNWVAPIGPHVNKFEEIVAEFCGRKGAIALSSGTAAIHMCLKYLGVQKDDYVLCPSFTFAGTVNPIRYLGAHPVFVDSEEYTWNICPEALEKAILNLKRKPKALITVDLYGQSTDYDKILKVCRKYDLPVIEDSAESLGAEFMKKKCGNFGKFSILSFNGNKIITTSGGGMILSDDTKALEKIRFWSTQARDPASFYQHSELGYNYRMSNILAALGLGQMEVLTKRVKQKKKVFEYYKKSFAKVPDIEMMPIYKEGKPNYWLSAITLKTNSKITPMMIVKALNKENIESRPFWKPMHIQPVFSDFLFFKKDEKYCVCEDLFERGVCLPSGSALTKEQLKNICEIIKNLFN